MWYVDDEVGSYKLIRELGHGSFGVVWLANQPKKIAAPHVAIKLPLRDSLKWEGMKKEALVWLESSNHPNVLPIIEADLFPTKSGNQIGIVSPYIAEGSLDEWIAQYGGKHAHTKIAVEIMFGILDGLAHLKDKNIVHRDLKPANILLQGNRPLIGDFGFARVLGESAQSSIIAGTRLYMSPEAHDGYRSHQTDLWSATIIFYQMLTGYLPFSTLKAIIDNRYEPKPLPESIPNALGTIFVRALKKGELPERYQSALEMKAALEIAYKSFV